ncbi:MAG: hypothetical protein V3S08_09215 [Phycisphaerales bacterium]
MKAKQLAQLREAIAAIEHGRHDQSGSRASASGADTLPLPPGVHEWFGLDDKSCTSRTSRWIPPLGILLYLARRSLEGNQAGVVWIGRRCWPFLQGLAPDDRGVLLRQSIFIDPPDVMTRLWAIDLAARCPAVAAVVADGSRLDMAATRRLQLAAEAGSALVLCARPPGEIDHLSAATTRWRVRCASSADKIPRWNVELLRCKGMRPEGQWTVEWRSAQAKDKGSIVVHAALADRPDPAAPAGGALVLRSA